MWDAPWLTVYETSAYLRRAADLLDEAQQAAVAAQLAVDPLQGDLIPGSGGLRKVRVGLEGRGKRGGARVIYYFGGVDMPLYLLAVYAKNERADLTKRELAMLAALVDVLRARHRLE